MSKSWLCKNVDHAKSKASKTLLNKVYSSLLKQLSFPYWRKEQEKSSLASLQVTKGTANNQTK